jgi:sporadic carbohydrate cluster protein (TIGR04323 family)
MQVVSWNDSISAMKEIHSKKLSTFEIEELCKKICWPTSINVGQSWLFNQGHIHGNVNNDTGMSRVSFDLRAMIKGSDYGFRYPGGFWRLHSEKNNYQIPKQLESNKRWITFSDQGSNYVGSTPQFIIREYLLNWCKSQNIKPVEWVNEYLHCDWNMTLQYVIDNSAIDGIILPSIYAMTAEPILRLKIMEKAIEKNIQMIFIDEDILLSSKESLEYIKRIYKYAYPTVKEIK